MSNLQATIQQVTDTIADAIGKAWHQPGPSSRPQRLAEQSEVVRAAIDQLGKEAFELFTIEKNGASDALLTAFVIDYQWSEQGKAFLILWRDVIFEMQKAKIFQLDGSVGEASVRQLDEDSRSTLAQAASELMAYLEQEVQSAKRGRLGTKKRLERWRVQKNPWPVYEQQLEALAKQCSELVALGEKLELAANHFQDVHRLIQEFLKDCAEEVARILVLDEKAMELAETHQEQPAKLAVAIENIEDQAAIKFQIEAFFQAMEGMIDKIPAKLNAVPGVSGGMLQTLEIPLQRRVRQWLESETVPLLYEIGELTESAANGMKMALINIRNRALLLAAESKEVKPVDYPKTDFTQPLRFFNTNLEKTRSEMSLLEHLTLKRLETGFRLSGIFQSGTEFLPVPLQSTIQQFSLGQNELVKKAKNWLAARTLFFQNLRRSVELEETLSISEKIARYIGAKEGDESNAHYANIFLTRGYIGESFAVGREAELGHFGKLVNNWKKGFRGAVCLSGNRFAGKSLFGELAANRFFPGKTYRLAPNESITVGGRKMDTGFELESVLDFVRKYTLNANALIWIDDLELWWEPGVPLARNVRSLIECMDDLAGHTFFMISASNWLKAHLDKILGFDRAFQAHINLDRMSPEEIRQAILIRHGATHKKLVDGKGQPLSPQNFKKITAAIHRVTEGNIGESLSRWSCSTWRLDEDHVENRFSPKYTIPDFLRPETSILLASVFMQKRTNEHRLRKLFGPSFTERNAHLVQRLVNTGILIRQLDGWLEVNDWVVNDVAQLLAEKGYLNVGKK